MESRRRRPSCFDALDNDLDHIAYVLDRLQKGEVDTVLPWIAVEGGAEDDRDGG